MDFTYGLAMFLVIFEGTIIRCEGTEGADPMNRIEDAPTFDTNLNVPILPNDVMELILSKTDYKTIKKAVLLKMVNETDIVMRKILQDHIILIYPRFNDKITEYYEDGELFLHFGVYKEFYSFFDKFGDKVKKIEFHYENDKYNRYQLTEFNEDIIQRIKGCAKILEELRIETKDDAGFWEEMLNEENGIIFPELKKLQLTYCSRNDLNLNFIFPKLESFKLKGSAIFDYSLANVKNLKELTLDSHLARSDDLEHIFKNNANMTKIFLSWPNRAESIQLIEKYLTKLETLEINDASADFLFRTNNNTVYKLPSVSHFSFSFNYINDELFRNGNLTFDMPELKKLTIKGVIADEGIMDFIKHFKKLETFELFIYLHDPLNCLGKFHHIKEFTTIYYANQIDSLENMFINFDEESELEILKFVDFDESNYKTYEDEMKRINKNLEKSEKSTWALSHGEFSPWEPVVLVHININQNYLMFRRTPCKSCKKKK